jgi:hypothetical protein
MGNQSCAICDKPFVLNDQYYNKSFDKVYHRECVTECVVCEKPIDTNQSIINGRPLHMECNNIKTKDKCRCRNPLYDITSQWSRQWTPTTHPKFPREFRKTLRTFLLVLVRLSPTMPKDIKHYIFNLAISPIAYKTQNTILVRLLCLPTRCLINAMCNLCEKPIQLVEYEDACTQQSCKKFQFRCPTCKTNIPHNADPQTSCTHYRCIFKKCKHCGGPVAPFKDTSSKTECRLDHCMFVNMQSNNTCVTKIQDILKFTNGPYNDPTWNTRNSKQQLIILKHYIRTTPIDPTILPKLLPYTT